VRDGEVQGGGVSVKVAAMFRTLEKSVGPLLVKKAKASPGPTKETIGDSYRGVRPECIRTLDSFEKKRH